MKAATCTLCLAALCLACGPWMRGAKAQEGVAQAPEPAPSSALAAVVSGIPTDGGLAGWTKVGDDALDEARGGFDLGNGLVASFGIDRAVYINGNLVTSTSFNVPDVAHMTTQQAQAMASALNSVSVTQVGPGNTFDPSSLRHGLGATVIQNTLNDQHIQSITTINTSTNSLNVLRQQNFQDALQQAQLQSLGGH